MLARCPAGLTTSDFGGELADVPSMLQQVSQLAPPAPHDRGPMTGEAMAVAGGAEAGAFDFPALLAQAEAQERVTPTGDIAPADTTTDQGTSGLPAGVMAGLVPAMPVPSRLEEAVQAAGHEGPALSDGILPAARTALAARVPPGDAAGDERAAAARISDLHPNTAEATVPEDPVEEPAPAFALKSEPASAQPTGPTPTLMVSPSLPEGLGPSMPTDPSMAGAGSLSGHIGSSPASSPVGSGLALPYQRLLHPPLSAQLAPAVLSMGVVPGADGGPGRLTVAIRPAELGTLQIITERAEDGTARIAVFAERPETLQLLVRDAPTLETALRAAGVDEGGGLSLTFGLANQGPGDGAGDARGDASQAPGRGDGADPMPDIIGSVHAMARTSLLDLSL